jgi:hypothetical protein
VLIEHTIISGGQMVTYYYKSGSIVIQKMTINMVKMEIFNEITGKYTALSLTDNEFQRLKQVLNMV